MCFQMGYPLFTIMYVHMSMLYLGTVMILYINSTTGVELVHHNRDYTHVGAS